MIPATTDGEAYDLGVLDGRQQGYRQARGEIVSGVLQRAAAADRQAATAPTVNGRRAAAEVAGWLRGIADQLKRGEL